MSAFSIATTVNVNNRSTYFINFYVYIQYNIRVTPGENDE
jgi:hypothetical protein